MEFFEILKKRKMIRRFKQTPIPNDVLKKLIYAGIRAPTAGNLGYRRLMLINDPRLLRFLRSVAPGYFESLAPAVIMVFTDLRVANESGSKTNSDWTARMDAGEAAETIHLAAVDIGLGSCIFSSMSVEGVKELLGLPDHCRPEVMVSLGYSVEEQPKPRKAPRDALIVHVNQYGREWDAYGREKRDQSRFA
jgi:nitroreductase